jgi:hypothetical protein
MLVNFPVYSKGCPASLMDAYQQDKLEVVCQACQSTDGTYLETLSGLSAFCVEAAEKLMEMGNANWEEDEY